MDAKTLSYQLGLNDYVVTKNAEGISHAESLAHPTQGGNCMNWIIGHIVRTRNQALQTVGKEPIIPMEKLEIYSGKAEQRPWDAEKAVRFDELMENFTMQQRLLLGGVEALTAEQLAAKAPWSPTNNPDETVGSLLASLVFHETYHAGQTGVLRRVTGKPGVLKSPEDG